MTVNANISKVTSILFWKSQTSLVAHFKILFKLTTQLHGHTRTNNV